MTPKQIIGLRRRLGESTEDFAARFGYSRRTVENWEQGRHRPHRMVLRELQALANTALTAQKKI